MSAPPASPPPPTDSATSERPGPGGGGGFLRKLGPVGVGLLFLGKLLAKLKFVLLPVLKFGLPVLKTGGTMLISIWFYAQMWGWWFALGFVLLMLVHESGHLIAARRLGLKVGAPVFIPFMGAFIALKDAPRNAWVEACVGIGGPLLGSLGAAACEGIFLLTGDPLFRALAYTGFFLNLFNLVPVGFLDGGRVASALSPWMWLAGFVIMVGIVVMRPNFLVIAVLLMSLPRVWSLFRPRGDAERRYFEVTPQQRGIIAVLYFGLVALLVWGMHVAHVLPAGRAA
jgi:Zn-dependent protease